ncbi:uncharacterized protein AMSG_04661 [Thecamonas trahens ATCC 50062]|uniref:Uncharacterized protein n=1 Tax=Thecamonas trahens ATCC 50062 TaxID=461836 RepID=A0A0L0D9Z7_THETB|nr:hypothetical protein AMSG_04661 [Thecamonas trahens ATCC 50062]KNC48916.1 hypothetical protein AMSG_04661 [Thecamonas trahens ATCC 50062]|eukprot:XP_013758333.1 hypothetical protein AMSG_04661 [Thecamonas trahens ATCC 50062]
MANTLPAVAVEVVEDAEAGLAVVVSAAPLAAVTAAVVEAEVLARQPVEAVHPCASPADARAVFAKVCADVFAEGMVPCLDPVSPLLGSSRLAARPASRAALRRAGYHGLDAALYPSLVTDVEYTLPSLRELGYSKLGAISSALARLASAPSADIQDLASEYTAAWDGRAVMAHVVPGDVFAGSMLARDAFVASQELLLEAYATADAVLPRGVDSNAPPRGFPVQLHLEPLTSRRAVELVAAAGWETWLPSTADDDADEFFGDSAPPHQLASTACTRARQTIQTAAESYGDSATASLSLNRRFIPEYPDLRSTASESADTPLWVVPRAVFCEAQSAGDLNTTRIYVPLNELQIFSLVGGNARAAHSRAALEAALGPGSVPALGDGLYGFGSAAAALQAALRSSQPWAAPSLVSRLPQLPIKGTSRWIAVFSLSASRVAQVAQPGEYAHLGVAAVHAVASSASSLVATAFQDEFWAVFDESALSLAAVVAVQVATAVDCGLAVGSGIGSHPDVVKAIRAAQHASVHPHATSWTQAQIDGSVGPPPLELVSATSPLRPISASHVVGIPWQLPSAPPTSCAGVVTTSGVSLVCAGASLSGTVVDMVGSFELLLHYTNTTRRALTSAFVFPLAAAGSAAVVGFQAQIGDRLLVSSVKRKGAARAAHTAAQAAGQASMLLQADDDAQAAREFRMELGAVAPSTSVFVRIEWVQELEQTSDAVRLTLPSSLFPTTRAPPRLLLAFESQYPIRDVSASPHFAVAKQTASKLVVASPPDAGSWADGDLWVTVSCEQAHAPRMWVEELDDSSRHRAALLAFYPRFDDDDWVADETRAGAVAHAHFVLALDASLGDKIEPAVLLMLEALQAEAVTSGKAALVELVMAGAEGRCPAWITPQPLALGPNTVQQLVHAASSSLVPLARAQAPGSKPVALAPVLAGVVALGSPRALAPGVPTTVVWISNGHARDVVAALAVLATPQASRLRVLGVGFDVAPGRSGSVLAPALAGGGAGEVLDTATSSLWRTQLARQARRGFARSLRNVAVEWHQTTETAGDNAIGLLQSPRVMGAIFEGEPVVVYGFVDYCIRASLRGQTPDGDAFHEVVYTQPLSFTRGRTVHALAAAALISDWEHGLLDVDPGVHQRLTAALVRPLENLALRFGLVSPFTALVATQESSLAWGSPVLDLEAWHATAASYQDPLPYLEWHSLRGNEREAERGLGGAQVSAAETGGMLYMAESSGSNGRQRLDLATLSSALAASTDDGDSVEVNELMLTDADISVLDGLIAQTEANAPELRSLDVFCVRDERNERRRALQREQLASHAVADAPMSAPVSGLASGPVAQPRNAGQVAPRKEEKKKKRPGKRASRSSVSAAPQAPRGGYAIVDEEGGEAAPEEDDMASAAGSASFGGQTRPQLAPPQPARRRRRRMRRDNNQNSSIFQAEADVARVQDAMLSNIDNLLDRGESIDVLMERSEQLVESSQVFLMRASRMQRPLLPAVALGLVLGLALYCLVRALVLAFVPVQLIECVPSSVTLLVEWLDWATLVGPTSSVLGCWAWSAMTSAGNVVWSGLAVAAPWCVPPAISSELMCTTLLIAIGVFHWALLVFGRDRVTDRDNAHFDTLFVGLAGCILHPISLRLDPGAPWRTGAAFRFDASFAFTAAWLCWCGVVAVLAHAGRLRRVRSAQILLHGLSWGVALASMVRAGALAMRFQRSVPWMGLACISVWSFGTFLGLVEGRKLKDLLPSRGAPMWILPVVSMAGTTCVLAGLAALSIGLGRDVSGAVAALAVGAVAASFPTRADGAALASVMPLVAGVLASGGCVGPMLAVRFAVSASVVWASWALAADVLEEYGDDGRLRAARWSGVAAVAAAACGVLPVAAVLAVYGATALAVGPRQSERLPAERRAVVASATAGDGLGEARAPQLVTAVVAAVDGGLRSGIAVPSSAGGRGTVGLLTYARRVQAAKRGRRVVWSPGE